MYQELEYEQHMFHNFFCLTDFLIVLVAILFQWLFEFPYC